MAEAEISKGIVVQWREHWTKPVLPATSHLLRYVSCYLSEGNGK